MEEAKSYKKYLKGLKSATSGKGSKNIKIRKLIGIAGMGLGDIQGLIVGRSATKKRTGGAMLKNPGKADLDKDGKLSGYEKKRGMAIEKAMSGKNKPMKAVSGALALGIGGKKMMKKKSKAMPLGIGAAGIVAKKKKELLGKMGGGMMKKYTKGGGADTGTAGETRSRFGVAKNKLKRLGKRIGRGMGAPITSGREMADKLRNKIAMAQRDKKKVQTKMGGGLAAATKRLKAQGKMGGGMMQRPMGYDKGGMKGKKKPIIKIAIGVGKAKDYPGIKKIMEMNKKGKKRFNTGGSVTVSSKLGRTKPTKLY